METESNTRAEAGAERERRSRLRAREREEYRPPRASDYSFTTIIRADDDSSEELRALVEFLDGGGEFGELVLVYRLQL